MITLLLLSLIPVGVILLLMGHKGRSWQRRRKVTEGLKRMNREQRRELDAKARRALKRLEKNGTRQD